MKEKNKIEDYIKPGTHKPTRLKALREDRDITLKSLGETLHLSPNVIWHHEKGDRAITLEQAIIYAKHFNVSLDYFAGLTDDRLTVNEKKLINFAKEIIKMSKKYTEDK